MSVREGPFAGADRPRRLTRDAYDPGAPFGPLEPQAAKSRRSLTAIMIPGPYRTGLPEPVLYDPARPHLKAREEQVAALVKAAKAEAARRHARRARG